MRLAVGLHPDPPSGAIALPQTHSLYKEEGREGIKGPEGKGWKRGRKESEGKGVKG